ncbi:MAG: DNA cytosine methyltransferase [Promethearchaeota archaeon]
MIIDLFSGAGGLSLGFEMVGFEGGLAVEFNEAFSGAYEKNHPDCVVLKNRSNRSFKSEKQSSRQRARAISIENGKVSNEFRRVTRKGFWTHF